MGILKTNHRDTEAQRKQKALCLTPSFFSVKSLCLGGSVVFHF